MKILKLSALFTLALGLTLQVNAFISAPGSYRMDIQMTPEQHKAFHSSTKTEVPEASAKLYSSGQFEHDFSVKLETRGQSSLKEFTRKNFSLKITKSKAQGKSSDTFKIGGIESDKIILSAGPEDPLLIKNNLSYKLLSALDVPSLATQYIEITINGESEGLYMLTVKQSQELIDTQGADIVFRRRYNDDVELKEQRKNLTADQVQAYTKTLNDLHRSLKKLHGEELYQYLNKHLNITNYFKWLALNYLTQNGDFIDEVYFFGKMKEGEIYFDISPWDLDDTFSERMHLANIPTFPNNGMSKESAKQLLFGYESRLDVKIASDAYLLEKYFQTFTDVVNTLTSDKAKIRNIFNGLYADLDIYIDDQDIQDNGLKDKAKSTHSRLSFADDLDSKINFISARLAQISAELEKINSAPDSVEKRTLKLSWIKKTFMKIDNALIRHFSKKD